MQYVLMQHLVYTPDKFLYVLIYYNIYAIKKKYCFLFLITFFIFPFMNL